MLQHNVNALNAKLNSLYLQGKYRSMWPKCTAYITGKAQEDQDIKYQNNNNY